jgi:hypothetical protein
MIYGKVVPVKIVNYTFVKQPKIVKDATQGQSDPKLCKRTYTLKHKSKCISTFS